MAIEIGGLNGVNLVWRDKSEQWQEHCVGAKKKQGPRVTCWGMIEWNYKGPFHIWEKETKEEKAEAAEKIKVLNAGWAAEQKRLNEEWKAPEEWRELRERASGCKGGESSSKIARREVWEDYSELQRKYVFTLLRWTGHQTLQISIP